jgi:mannose-6-phosphate isomerase
VAANSETFKVYMCVEGSFQLDLEDETYNYVTGDTVLVPAEMGSFSLSGVAKILEIYI